MSPFYAVRFQSLYAVNNDTPLDNELSSSLYLEFSVYCAHADRSTVPWATWVHVVPVYILPGSAEQNIMVPIGRIRAFRISAFAVFTAYVIDYSSMACNVPMA